MSNLKLLSIIFCVLIPLTAALSGCSGRQSSYSEARQRISTVGILYGQYMANNQGRSPSNLKQLIDFVKHMPGDQLEVFKIDKGDLVKFLRSPRDSQPYVIRKSAKLQGSDVRGFEGQGAVTVYEKTADANGYRYVVFSTTAVFEVNQDNFAKLVPEAH